MRHSAVTFAKTIAEEQASSCDVIFCSDMLNLAEFRGLCPQAISRKPAVAYFHENQLTYPVRFPSERDYQFAVTNMTTALAARRVWFNSEFHRDEFLAALQKFLKLMPDFQPFEAVERIRERSDVFGVGVDISARRPPDRRPGPMRILWAARWEHDKNPEDFFEAIEMLESRGIDYRLSVIGEQFREYPKAFDRARHRFAAKIDKWGYLPARDEYEGALVEADVFVSTANHEFLGISCIEACMAGAYPILPQRLAYPEILRLDEDPDMGRFFYDGSPNHLAQKLVELSGRIESAGLVSEADNARRVVERFRWPNIARRLDDAVENLLAFE